MGMTKENIVVRHKSLNIPSSKCVVPGVETMKIDDVKKEVIL